MSRLFCLLLFLAPGLFAGEVSLETIERRIREAKTFSFDFEITSSEAVSSSFKGHLETKVSNHVELKGKGTFQTQPVELNLETRDGNMVTAHHNQPADADLSDTMRVSFMRKGLLHHLAVHSLKHPIDGTKGVADKTWILKNLGKAAPKKIDGKAVIGFKFELTVDGIKSAVGTLWVDKATGLPVQRDQDVFFTETQIMKVVEVYANVVIQ